MKKIFILCVATLILGTAGYAVEYYGGNTYESSIETTDPVAQSYALSVGPRIFMNLKLPNTQADLTTKVLFKIADNGSLVSSKIIQASGNSDYDARVLDAIKRSAPFARPTYPEITTQGVILTVNSNMVKFIQSSLNGVDLENLLPGANQPAQKPVIQKPVVKQTGNKKFVTPQ